MNYLRDVAFEGLRALLLASLVVTLSLLAAKVVLWLL